LGRAVRYDEVLEDLDRVAALDATDAAVLWGVETLENC